MTTTSMSPGCCRLLLYTTILASAIAPKVTLAGDSPLRSTTDPVLLPVPESENSTEAVYRAAMESSSTEETFILTGGTVEGGNGNRQQTVVQPRVTEVKKGSSSRRLRKAAVESLPMPQLHPQHRQAANAILDDMSLFRQLPAFQCELDPRVHDYFTKHPDVAVSIWRAMAISNLHMTQRNGVQYDLDTRDGTTGTVTVLHHSRESCLVLCNGMFKSPYLKNAIHAKSLMHLRTNVANSPDGRTYITHQAELFVSFPSQGVGTVARLISPVSNSIIDRNFQEICLFIHVMWQAMQQQPGWVEQIAGRLDGVQPARKDELIKLTADVYVTGRTDAYRRSGQPISLEVIRPPGPAPTQTATAPQTNRPQ